MTVCASPGYLKRYGTPRTPEDLRRAQRLVFTEAVSAGDWTLIDTKNRAHVIDGMCRMSANNMQMLLAAALAGAGVTYGPTFVFGEYLARGELVALLPGYRASELTIQAVYPSARHVMPLAAKTLGDFGAEVIEIEPPGVCDPLRPWRTVGGLPSGGDLGTRACMDPAPIAPSRACLGACALGTASGAGHPGFWRGGMRRGNGGRGATGRIGTHGLRRGPCSRRMKSQIDALTSFTPCR
jgi:hypothetical protein